MGDVPVSSCYSEAQKLRRQVSTLSEFGKRALRSDDIGGLLQEATRLVSDAIDVDLVKVLELLPGGENLLVRAGVNWNPGVVGHAEIPAHEGSSAGYALHKNEPVITEDTEREIDSKFQIYWSSIASGAPSTSLFVARTARLVCWRLTRGSSGNSSKMISISFRITPICWLLPSTE